MNALDVLLDNELHYDIQSSESKHKRLFNWKVKMFDERELITRQHDNAVVPFSPVKITARNVIHDSVAKRTRDKKMF